jgi:PAS domain S-box-containing protein
LAAQGFTQRRHPWHVFALAAVLMAVAVALFIAFISLRIGGEVLTNAVDDIGEGTASLIAALSCGLAAGRSRGRLRVAWALLAASAASWLAGEIVWSVYELGLRVPVPYPSAADFGYLGAIPLAVAGILTFSQSPRGTSIGVRQWLDRAIVFLALLFVAWVLGLNLVFADQDPLFEQLIDLAYPLGDIAIGTVLVLAIRRATAAQQGRLLLLLAGLAANTVADSAFTHTVANNTFDSLGSVLDAGWVIGYLMIALAALWPSRERDQAREEKPIDVWQLALPWLAILAAGLSAVWAAIGGRSFDTFSAVLLGVLAVLLMFSQILAHTESLALLIRSRLSARTLNEVIAYAPLGVVRIGADLTILQANPSFASMLRTTAEELTGAPIARFFSSTDIARASERFRVLRGQAGVTADFDTEATRADSTTIWLHWTATTVPKASGGVDYYLVMLEDVSARRAAEAVAAANLEVLQRLNKVKSQFLTKVSHEFRTALVGIQGFSEFIREADTLEVSEVKEFATDIYEDAQRLNKTLDDMLEIDRSEGGQTELQLVEVDIALLVSEAVVAAQIGTVRHIINTDLETLPMVKADADLLSQVITSLIGRAIDYSPDGAPILVTTRVTGAQVQITVRDRGRGSASDLEAQLLGHGDLSVSRDHVRTLASNVGLPLARQIIEMHGGRMWFDVGAETVLSFSLPVAAKAATLELVPALV